MPSTRPESILQAKALKEVRKLGGTCFVTSGRRKNLSSKGMPDVFLWIDHSSYVGVEFKTPTGTLEDSQSTFVKNGRVRVVRSVEEFIKLWRDAVFEWHTKHARRVTP
jgi:hypothetical protein